MGTSAESIYIVWSEKEEHEFRDNRCSWILLTDLPNAIWAEKH